MRPIRPRARHPNPPPNWTMLLFGALLCLAAAPAYAQITIVEAAELDFGAVVDLNGSVVLDLNDTITSDPSGIHVGGFISSGIYTIQGDALRTVDINIVAQNSNGLNLSSFTTSEGSPPILNAALDALGELDLTVGATLTVESSLASPGFNQALAYTFTVNYN